MADRNRIDEVVRRVLNESVDAATDDDWQESIINKLNTSRKSLGSSSRTKKGGKGTENSVPDQAADIAGKVAEILLPAISSVLDRIITRRVETVVRNLTEAVLEETSKTVERLEISNRLLRYECDRLEQYSRRETVRISGLPEEDSEDTEKNCDGAFPCCWLQSESGGHFCGAQEWEERC
ncbi:hypothetical protein BaRGS_00023220 [Batillaria attramentaria]|uniref:Uncharacterized protein n=1 Tax=Batillaria attramentaria TaxID=370345 RepID=A0ABD0KES3_9CAEN